ncbi:DUF2786 domain-containing protein [Micromonospora sp. ALFpr18c]|uniref:DUF2786 domain-containing protein n=1 Tax=unclassified Micromonospora TaxID=2617518 RepID=UPI00124B5C33|nr:MULTISPECIES: DUF2786 domain-containing protein [unclassified Micromonospora]KAB1940340.1 DUF2786 domain-containing protein [Micromonospora sp. ALFpr18c]MDG4760951.1 DUF2786 domain-containing protein [Micromonospora sp. WMMD710]
MSEAMLSKVRKLLAQAEDPACTPAESAAFTAKAAELIARYGVDRALLAARDPATDPVGDRVLDVVAPYARDKVGLLAAVAEPLRCRCIRRRQGNGFTLHLFGFASDLERVDLLFTSLLVQAAHGLAATPVPADDHPAAFRRSWLAGFAEVIGGRLWAAETAAVNESGTPSVALVLADRSDRVQRRLAEQYPRLRTAPPRRLAGTGFGSGAEAGSRADLGGHNLGGGSAAGRQLGR